MSRHRWGEKVDFWPAQASPAHKSERECLNGCGVVKTVWHQTEGGRDKHWTEFWRGLDRIEGTATPSCEPVTADA